MITPELKSYIDSLKKIQPPVAIDFLRAELEKVGWKENDIDEAVTYFFAGPSAKAAWANEAKTPAQKSVSSAMNNMLQNIVSSATPESAVYKAVQAQKQPSSYVSGNDLTPDEIFRNSGIENASKKGPQTPIKTPENSERPQAQADVKNPLAGLQGLGVGTPESAPMAASLGANGFPSEIPNRAAGLANPQINKRPDQPIVGMSGAPGRMPMRLMPSKVTPGQDSRYMGGSSRGIGKVVGILIALIALAALATGAYLYFSGEISFGKAPLREDHLLLDMVKGFGQINGADVRVEYVAAVKKRDVDAKPFAGVVLQEDDRYSRDQDRFRDLGMILGELESYYSTKQKYPETLSVLEDMPLKDPSGPDYDYMQTAKGQNFSLKIAFETPEGKNEALIGSHNSLSTDGKVEFDNMSSKYYYFTGAENIFADLIQPDQPGIFEFVPADLRLNLSIDGPITIKGVGVDGVDMQDLLDRDFLINFKADLNWTPVNAAADISFMYKEGKFFLRLNKMPKIDVPFFGGGVNKTYAGLSDIVGKWVDLTGEEFVDDFTAGMALGQGEEFSELTKEMLTAQKDLLTLADAKKIVLSKTPPVREKMADGTYASKYNLTLSKVNFVNFYKRALTEISMPGDFSLSPELLSYLEDDAYQPIFDYFYDNTIFSVWVTEDTGIPVKSQIALRIVPPDSAENFADKQIVLLGAVSYSNINNPTQINMPAEKISAEEAEMIITGKTLEQFKFEKQMDAVEKIRQGIRSYYFNNKSYPNSLDDIIQKEDGCEYDLDADTDCFYYSYGKLSKLPEDAYGKDSFVYKKSGTDYTFKYYVEVPDFEIGEALGSLVDIVYNETSGKKKYLLKVVDGMNTATAAFYSMEAEAASKNDRDADKLPDVIEDAIGTDKTKKDTDGDGVNDYDEISTDYNPLGPGKLEIRPEYFGSPIDIFF